MKTMTELISFFQLEYPELVSEMKGSTHHLSNGEDAITNEKVRYKGRFDDPYSLNPYHLESDVFTHTMMVCKQAENASYEVQIAALLHDIGKPSTRKINPKNGRVSFYNHDAVSAFMSLEILNRPELNLTKEQKVKIFNMIALHTQIYKLSVEQLAAIGDLDLVEGLIELGKADHAGRFHTAGDAVIPSIDDIKFASVAGTFSDNREKEVVILVGLPASGKSTWKTEYVNRDEDDTDVTISRDFCLLYEVLLDKSIPDGLTYSEKWNKVDQKKVDKTLQWCFKEAKGKKKVIVDMTHMSKKSRRKSLSHFGSEYKKKCVVFLPDMKNLFLQNENRCGKVIGKDVIERMMRSFYPPTMEEFDEIEYVI
jgi:putative nucleotidyltransferase with HDIG domain